MSCFLKQLIKLQKQYKKGVALVAKENVIKFINSMAKNNELVKKFGQLKTLDEMYDFAKKNSESEFTKEEFSEIFDSLPSVIAKLNSGEISESDLENVGGGFLGFGESKADRDARWAHEEKMRGHGATSIGSSWSYTGGDEESTGRTVVMGISGLANLISAFTNAYQAYFQTKIYNDQQQEKAAALAALANQNVINEDKKIYKTKQTIK